MGLGYDENDASGLKVWNMEDFHHPGGKGVLLGRCNGIYCTWFDDNDMHAAAANDTQDLYAKLRHYGAVELGNLAPMDCEGNRNQIFSKLFTRILSIELYKKSALTVTLTTTSQVRPKMVPRTAM